MSDEETVDIPSLIIAAQEYVQSVSSPPIYEGQLVEALLTQLSAALVREQTATNFEQTAIRLGAATGWSYGHVLNALNDALDVKARAWDYGRASSPEMRNPYRPTPVESEESQ